MWIMFTTPKGSGFVSVVAKNQDNQPSDTIVCLRFRRREDAAKLIPWNVEVIDTPDGDYACRVYMYKGHWALLMESLAKEITYDNFKDSIPEDDDALYTSCNRIWSELAKLQPGGPYGWMNNLDYIPEDDLAGG